MSCRRASGVFRAGVHRLIFNHIIVLVCYMRLYFRENERHIFVDTLIKEFGIELDHLKE